MLTEEIVNTFIHLSGTDLGYEVVDPLNYDNIIGVVGDKEEAIKILSDYIKENEIIFE